MRDIEARPAKATDHRQRAGWRQNPAELARSHSPQRRRCEDCPDEQDREIDRDRCPRCPTVSAVDATRAGPPNTDDPWPVASVPSIASAFPSHASLLRLDVLTSMTPPDLSPNSGGTWPTSTFTESTISGSGATPCKLSIRSYIGTPSTTYKNPSSTPRAWSSPLSSVAHPGVVAIASCNPRLLNAYRGAAHRVASERRPGRGGDGLSCLRRDVDLFLEGSREPQLKLTRVARRRPSALSTTASNGGAVGSQGIAADGTSAIRNSPSRAWTVVTGVPS